MTLKKLIAKGEAMGLRLRGFFVAPDVYERIERETKPGTNEYETLSAIAGFAMHTGGMSLFQDAWLPRGCISPCWESDPSTVPAFTLGGSPLASTDKTGGTP